LEDSLPNLLAHWLWDALYRNWALTSILGTLLLLVSIPALILRKYVLIARNILDDTPPPMSMGLFDFERIEGERFDFHSFDGHALNGMILRAARTDEPRGLIVFAHEYASDAYSCARYCRPLLDAGYEVLTFDFRGHGRSGGEQDYKPRQWATEREQSDMLGAIAYAEDYLAQRRRPSALGLFGISRGAGAAILGAVGVPSVRVIVTDGAFSTDTTLEHLMKRWSTIFARVRVVAESHPPVFWRFLRWLLLRHCKRKFGCRFPSVRKAIVRLGHTPILFIHGARDSLIPVTQSKLLYELAKGPKELWIVPSAKHNHAVVAQPQEYARRIVRFFDAHLAGVASAAGEPSAEAGAVPAPRSTAPVVTGESPAERLPLRQNRPSAAS